MSFMDRFFSTPIPTGTDPADSMNSFATLSQNELEAHLDVQQYGDFQLTKAVRPAADLKIAPSEGYRHDVYVDDDNDSKVSVVMAAASKEKLFPVFLSLIEKLGPTVDVVLETSHNSEDGQHKDLYRESIDTPVLLSLLGEYEDLLVNDGCTGIAVLNPQRPQEVQFDEHKLLIMYGSPLEPFEFVLENNGITWDQNIRFLSEAEHIHSSTEDYRIQFEEFKNRLGMTEQPEHLGEEGVG